LYGGLFGPSTQKKKENIPAMLMVKGQPKMRVMMRWEVGYGMTLTRLNVLLDEWLPEDDDVIQMWIKHWVE
jgi:hypothetical protein